ncbi:unnamed protein product [Protopolystoma xenopodis]|uniref:Uncharacterized protein n=1 Tax=Protopolystoma xenopodis TaxID=117903 RepID=A0A448XBP9_9PLAT|nr:unnamed protein product [Protopolystoma xenopodis]
MINRPPSCTSVCPSNAAKSPIALSYLPSSAPYIQQSSLRPSEEHMQIQSTSTLIGPPSQLDAAAQQPLLPLTTSMFSKPTSKNERPLCRPECKAHLLSTDDYEIPIHGQTDPHRSMTLLPSEHRHPMVNASLYSDSPGSILDIATSKQQHKFSTNFYAPVPTLPSISHYPHPPSPYSSHSPHLSQPSNSPNSPHPSHSPHSILPSHSPFSQKNYRGLTPNQHGKYDNLQTQFSQPHIYTEKLPRDLCPASRQKHTFYSQPPHDYVTPPPALPNSAKMVKTSSALEPIIPVSRSLGHVYDTLEQKPVYSNLRDTHIHSNKHSRDHQHPFIEHNHGSGPINGPINSGRQGSLNADSGVRSNSPPLDFAEAVTTLVDQVNMLVERNRRERILGRSIKDSELDSMSVYRARLRQKTRMRYHAAAAANSAARRLLSIDPTQHQYHPFYRSFGQQSSSTGGNFHAFPPAGRPLHRGQSGLSRKVVGSGAAALLRAPADTSSTSTYEEASLLSTDNSAPRTELLHDGFAARRRDAADPQGISSVCTGSDLAQPSVSTSATICTARYASNGRGCRSVKGDLASIANSSISSLNPPTGLSGVPLGYSIRAGDAENLSSLPEITSRSLTGSLSLMSISSNTHLDDKRGTRKSLDSLGENLPYIPPEKTPTKDMNSLSYNKGSLPTGCVHDDVRYPQKYLQPHLRHSNYPIQSIPYEHCNCQHSQQPNTRTHRLSSESMARPQLQGSLPSINRVEVDPPEFGRKRLRSDLSCSDQVDGSTRAFGYHESRQYCELAGPPRHPEGGQLIGASRSLVNVWNCHDVETQLKSRVSDGTALDDRNFLYACPSQMSGRERIGCASSDKLICKPFRSATSSESLERENVGNAAKVHEEGSTSVAFYAIPPPQKPFYSPYSARSSS